jgi:putative oxidoreductase
MAPMGAADLGLLILRLVVGLTFAAHGAQKAFGWWGGPGWNGWQAALGRMGFKPTPVFAALSVGAELVAGLFLAVGLLTPLAATMIVGQSVVIIAKVHAPHGFWNKASGIEFPLALAAGAVAIGLTGPGAVSVDGLDGMSLSETLRVALMLVGLIGGTIALAVPAAMAHSSVDSRT